MANEDINPMDELIERLGEACKKKGINIIPEDGISLHQFCMAYDSGTQSLFINDRALPADYLAALKYIDPSFTETSFSYKNRRGVETEKG